MASSKKQRYTQLDLPPLPRVFRGVFRARKGPAALAQLDSSAQVKRTFPSIYGGNTIIIEPSDSPCSVGRRCNIGVVIAGGPAPGIVYMLTGLYSFIRKWNASSRLFGFVEGPTGLASGDAIELTEDVLVDMQNNIGIANIGTGRAKIADATLERVKATCLKLDLDGLLILGGFDTNTDAARLAEYFKANKVPTCVITTAKRAEGVRADGVEMSFGFDSVTKLYSQLVGNVGIDAASARASWHFVRLMGERASNISLEVCLQAHANATIISEEVEANGWGIIDIVNYLCDIIARRAKIGKNFGVAVIPEGIVHSTRDLRELITELNDLIAKGVPTEQLPDTLTPASLNVFLSLPEWVRIQILGDRDPHGNVRMASIQLERFLAQMCEAELKRRAAAGAYNGKFAYNCHFYGYEARCCNASTFDRTLAFALGHVVGALVERGQTGMLATITNLTKPVEEWQARGIPLTALMHVDRHGQPIVRRSEVDLNGYVFRALKDLRDNWIEEDLRCSPVGPLGDDLNITLQLEELERRHKEQGYAILQHQRDIEYLSLVRAAIIEHSEFRRTRLAYDPRLPPVLQGGFRLVPEETRPFPFPELKEMFSVLESVPTYRIAPNTEGALIAGRALTIGVVLSGGPAPGGNNIISGLYDYLKARNRRSRLLGFLDGPTGLVSGNVQEITTEVLEGFRNQGGFHLIGTSRTKVETVEQFEKCREVVERFQMDGVVVCGGDDSNTNAALLANYFSSNGVHCSVVGLPKTIDADLRSTDVEMSFGFDTTTKLYSQLVANIAFDAAASRSVYHFIRLMGRSASHITLECALQTHANYAVVSEEVEAKKMTMVQIVHEITDIICKRAEQGKNHGIILIPEGLVEFTVDMKALIKELNEVLASGVPQDQIASQLKPETAETYSLLPDWLRAQLLAERDPHGNVRVSQIESERMVAALTENELKRRAAYASKFHFRYWCHFLGYQGRCSLPSNFDCDYCFTLGHMAGALVEGKATAVIAAVSNLNEPPNKWILRGLPLVSMMSIERRHGAFKPVIRKLLVELDSPVFKYFAEHRQKWATEDSFPAPQRVSELSCVSDDVCLTLQMTGTPKIFP
eukprot:TRINITY_DN21746_c0_g1_i1.p1 TRINITY_DN21746_c0_g1~~TRINITY_DN21746_c0_g1_i1.p1  ORF type:complete len:1102 (-),score=189.21 TRINITY_DN21746_c0_g1_i1:81-3365(-)